MFRKCKNGGKLRFSRYKKNGMNGRLKCPKLTLACVPKNRFIITYTRLSHTLIKCNFTCSWLK